ncbi:MAG: response regulator [bacterium]|nr:response regulator [bacterium]
MKTILTVDDSPSVRQMVSYTVRSAGYDVIEAKDGAEALELAQGRSFDMVLTDQNMPRLDGFGLIGQLRNDPRFSATPIIMLTTEASDEMKARGKAVRATGWMVKPFDPDTLLAVIQRLIG